MTQDGEGQLLHVPAGSALSKLENGGKTAAVAYIFSQFPSSALQYLILAGVSFVFLFLVTLIWRFALLSYAAIVIVVILLCLPCCVTPPVCVKKLKFMSCKRITCWLLYFTAIVIVGIVLGTVWRAAVNCRWSDQTNEAYTAWFSWQGAPTDSAVKASLRAAILASNPHNTQPWFFHVASSSVPTTVRIYEDTSRVIGTIDPYGRERHLGIGCALENFLIALAAHGLSNVTVTYPDPATDTTVDIYPNIPHKVRVEVIISDTQAGAPQVTELYKAIPNRHTNRAEYTGAPFTSGMLATMQTIGASDADTANVSVLLFSDSTERNQVGQYIVEATEALNNDAAQSADSFAWQRASCAELKDKKSGLWYDCQGLSAFNEFMSLTLPPLSKETNDKYFLTNVRDHQIPTASGFLLIGANNASSPMERIQAGRVWQRLHLWATSQGLAMQPENQVLERKDREHMLGVGAAAARFTTVLNALTPEGVQSLMMARFGYPTERAVRSARRPLDDVLLQ